MAVVIDWQNTASPEVLRPVLDAIAQGLTVVLPTEAGYLRVRGEPFPESTAMDVVNLVPAPESVWHDWHTPERSTQRLIDRTWPGSLEVRVAPTGRRYRSPRHPVWDVLWNSGVERLFGAPGESGATTVEHAIGAEAETAVAVAAGSVVPVEMTVVAVDDQGWKLERAGSIDSTVLVEAAAKWIVFLCTGNTCRSPMAEVICKDRLAKRLGCSVQDLVARGYRVLSAGLAAFPGDSPSEEAVAALGDLGAGLGEHRSQPLVSELAAHADQLIAMTRSHLLGVLTRYPVVGGNLRLLGGVYGDVEDPIGSGVETYAACARQIQVFIDRLITELITS